MLVQSVVQVEPTGVAELEQQHGGEGLGDRADAVLGMQCGLALALHVSEAGHARPYDGAVPDHSGRHARHPPGALEGAEPRRADTLQGFGTHGGAGALHGHWASSPVVKRCRSKGRGGLERAAVTCWSYSTVELIG